MPEIDFPTLTWGSPGQYRRVSTPLADWERELLDDQQEFAARPQAYYDPLDGDSDLDSLLIPAQPAPTSKPTDRPPTADELFALLPIGGRFFLQGPNVGQSHFFTVRTKVSVTHYKRDGESTRRRGDGFSASTKLIRTT